MPTPRHWHCWLYTVLLFSLREAASGHRLFQWQWIFPQKLLWQLLDFHCQWGCECSVIHHHQTSAEELDLEPSLYSHNRPWPMNVFYLLKMIAALANVLASVDGMDYNQARRYVDYAAGFLPMIHQFMSVLM